ncbi:hypothetical protein, partial [Mesorhizobium sp. M7A.F.Ca.CA.004.04.2.1]|uniref:hypothetical protein n=1 Tax=Mesorhizobium sp. M7A.F.Ca.CA.004.04.2.1 TaxID=2496677 RepID=UPI0019D43ECA
RGGAERGRRERKQEEKRRRGEKKEEDREEREEKRSEQEVMLKGKEGGGAARHVTDRRDDGVLHVDIEARTRRDPGFSLEQGHVRGVSRQALIRKA